MALFRLISQSFWTDSKVADDFTPEDNYFTPEDKYFYLYLLTNPHTNLCGCYEISMRQIAYETGYNLDTVERLIDRFRTIHKVIDYDRTTKEILILNWWKYNWTRSDKLLKAVKKALPSIKCEAFRKYIEKAAAVDNSVDNYRENTVSIPYAYPMDTTISISNTDSNSISISNTDSNTNANNNIQDLKREKREETQRLLGEARRLWENRGTDQ